VRVIVDTAVWSLALRRATPVVSATAELSELIREGRVVMLGAIRQELLSGTRTDAQFERLRALLRPFEDIEVGAVDHEEAARCFTRCRRRGVQGSNTDFLLCAVALARDLSVFTTDRDFTQYRRILGIRLHEPRSQ
jgi:predicted nucleic acid-binding protein